MTALLFRPLLRPGILGLGLGLSLATLHTLQQRPIRLDLGPVLSDDSYRRNAQMKKGQLNPRAIRQISSGSIIGLCAGLAVSTFSKSLAVIIGLLVLGVQWASSYGIHILPYTKLQKYVKNIDLRSAVHDNVGFKLSFGTTFAMAAFVHL